MSEAVYLVDIICEDGSNISNVRNRLSKGLGLVTQILTILQTVSFGVKYFEIAVALREAMLINGMLGSSEIWYGLKKSRIRGIGKC